MKSTIKRTWLKDTPFAKEWHPTKNHPVSMDSLYHQSAYVAWWNCLECGHEWQMKVANRTEGRECPKCRLKQRSLATKAPELAKEWDLEKNFPLTPEDVFVKSNRPVWWKCDQGHSYEMEISRRVGRKECPICKKENHLNEQALTKHYPQLAKEWNVEKNLPLTVDEVSIGSQKRVWWKCQKGHEWEAIVASRVRTMSCPTCQREERLKRGNLGVVNPELAKEWHPTKNGALTPFDLLSKSNRKVWWKCEHGHEWEATLLSRSNGSGCLTCYRERSSEGRSLTLFSPELAKEWHPTKNEGLSPDKISYRSNRYVWWKCSEGHEFEATVNQRYSVKLCPVCRENSKRMSVMYPEYEKFFDAERNAPLTYKNLFIHSNESVWWRCEKGHYRKIQARRFVAFPSCVVCEETTDGRIKNSLAEKSPDVAKEWHPTKNGGLTPEKIKWKSSQAVWWKCEHGHEWENRVAVRTNGAGCPVCRLLKRKTLELSPIQKEELKKEWHPTKNESFSFETISITGKHHVWWKCQQSDCNHEWEDSVERRLKGYTCPECRIRKDSVASKYPKLVGSWVTEKNAPLKIERLSHKSSKSVWWSCEKGHHYRRTVANRLNQMGCPKCLKEVDAKGTL